MNKYNLNKQNVGQIGLRSSHNHKQYQNLTIYVFYLVASVKLKKKSSFYPKPVSYNSQ